MSIIERIASVFEAGSGAGTKAYSEEQMEKFAKDAYLSANFALIIPLLIMVPFRYAPRAKMSTNIKTVEKAKKAERIAVYDLLIWGGFLVYIFSTN
ncbi:MAG: hypothetical protein HYV45_02165 [Candidatus Moranbacteria bacterium]|nr:hypothetical protein [Candidatus Moranbacteria bacterium]